MIYLLDVDLNGNDSVKHHVDAGRIVYKPIPNQDVFEKFVMEQLLPKVGPDDLVILDTINSMLETSRWDAKLGTDPQKNLLERKHLYLEGDKNYLTVYSWAGDSIIKRLKYLRAVGCRLITTSHESEVIDPVSRMKKRGPYMNDAALGAIKRVTSDIFRIYELYEAVTNDQGVITVPAGTRMLRLRADDETTAKYHVRAEWSSQVPDTMRVPLTGGLHRLYQKLDKRPSWLHLYGVEGVGKTTFACSEAESLPTAKKVKEVTTTPLEVVT